MALNLNKADDTLIIGQRNKQPMEKICCGGSHRERTRVQRGRYPTGAWRRSETISC
jgi:hypothetical protein